jgi:hypothetical protein
MEVSRTLPDDSVVMVVFLGVFGLFAAACFLPCVDCGRVLADSSGDVAGSDFLGERGSHSGLELLLVGWCGGNNGVPWSANVFLFLGYGGFVFRRYRAAAVLGLIATALGLSTWWVRRYDTLMVGYYVWQASQFVLAAGALWALHSTRRHTVHAASTEICNLQSEI